MEKRRVIHIAFDTLGMGGVTAVIMSILNSLHNDFEMSVLCMRPAHHKRVKELKELGVNLVYLPLGKFGKLASKHKTLENIFRPMIVFIGCLLVFKNKRFDIVHCHNASEGGWALLAAKICGIKTRIMHSHNTNPPHNQNNVIVRLYRTIQLWVAIKCSNRYCGCSKQASIDMFGKSINADIINNSIDIKKYINTNKRRPKGHHFVHVGRMNYQKNQEYVLDVFNIIRSSFPDAELSYVGEGPILPQLKNRAIELNLNPCVHFYPADYDVPSLLKESDYMIFPSRYEGFGIVVIEAQVANVIVFASDVVPISTNIGLCNYLPLELGIGAWAKYICEFIERGEKMEINSDLLVTYDDSYIAQQYKSLYLK